VNTSGNGGAISAYATESGSVVTLTQSTINGNIAKNSGGGIFILGSKLYINQNTRAKGVPKVEVYNNSAVLGGNIYLESSTLIATKTTTSTEKHFEVRNGRAHEFGGGLACVGSTVEMDDVLVVDNKAILDGGGIYGVLCLFKAQSTSITRNNAGGNGGGLFFQSISNIALENVDVSQNNAGGNGGGLSAVRARLFFMSTSIVSLNNADEGGGLHLDNTLSEPILQDLEISTNTAKLGGGGGILWESKKPRLARTEMIQGVHKQILDYERIMDLTFTGGNSAQYGNKIASGITTLKVSLADNQIFGNMLPFDPEIEIQVLDYYKKLVKRVNKPTSVIASVRSGNCLNPNFLSHRPNRSDLGECWTPEQGLRGKPVQEIPGEEGKVNFTKLGLRSWPGNHTLKIEIPGVDFVLRTVTVEDCD
jgi:hypothetical protein